MKKRKNKNKKKKRKKKNNKSENQKLKYHLFGAVLLAPLKTFGKPLIAIFVARPNQLKIYLKKKMKKNHLKMIKLI
jgi:hypothetical protein